MRRLMMQIAQNNVRLLRADFKLAGQRIFFAARSRRAEICYTARQRRRGAVAATPRGILLIIKESMSIVETAVRPEVPVASGRRRLQVSDMDPPDTQSITDHKSYKADESSNIRSTTP